MVACGCKGYPHCSPVSMVYRHYAVPVAEYSGLSYILFRYFLCFLNIRHILLYYNHEMHQTVFFLISSAFIFSYASAFVWNHFDEFISPAELQYGFKKRKYAEKA